MRGEQHVFFSLLSAAVLFPVLNFTNNPYLLVLIFAGIFVGSLAPDADAADSAIMHGISGGSGGLRTIRRHTILILPFFGYTVRYLIYFPVSFMVWVFTLGKIRPKHRGLLHSLFGVSVASVLLYIYISLVILLITGKNPATFSNPVAFLCAGFFVGCVMHLLEDTCTLSGVFWVFPFKQTKLSGNVTPNGRKNWIILLILGFAAIFSLYISSNLVFYPQLSAFLPLLIFSVAWTLIFFISDVSRS